MFLLGLLLLAAACVAAVELILANHSQVTFTMWNQHYTFDKFWLAVIGAAIMLAALLGLWMMSGSAARQRRIRRERKELAAENERLSKRVATPAPNTVAARDGVPANRPGAYNAPAAYPAAPAAPGAAAAPNEPVEERRGFFARHAMSGRHGH